MDGFPFSETISAVATPIGEAGIGIVKISGPDALTCLRRIFRARTVADAFASHRLHLGWIVDPSTDQRLDEVLVSYMKAPRSYTGEDVVEINCHSGYAILDRILRLVLAQGVRLAEPGEFTRRAFMNGRLDLSQAEAVVELIRSRSEQELAIAGRQLRGELSETVHAWRRRLLNIEARLEAFLDFPEEREEEEGSSGHDAVSRELRDRLLPAVREFASRYDEQRVLREGLALVLAGKPNVGKSSLLNALVGRDRAIVTPIPGTTRDIIEDTFVIQGICVRVLDTAGVRSGADTIESCGIERALRCVEEADLVIWLIDASRPLSCDDDLIAAHVLHRPHLVVLNKADLPQVVERKDVFDRYPGVEHAVSLSVLRPDDIQELRETIRVLFLRDVQLSAHPAFIPNLRQKQALDETASALGRAARLIADGDFLELVAAEVRAARTALESIVGIGTPEDLLDEVFSKFCIGK